MLDKNGIARRIAQELLDAPSAAVYGRMGTTTSGLTNDDAVTPMATLASWLIDIINIAIGSLDRPGGVMFPLPIAGGPSTEGTPGTGLGVQIPGRRRTRVRKLPSALGEFPASALAEEIDTPDPDTGEHIRAVFVIGGNPIVSTSIRDEDDVIEYTTDPELIYEKWQNLVDVVIDGGYGDNVASTVIDLSEGEPTVLREG